MKVKAYTTIKKSVGNVIPNYNEAIEAEAVKEKGDCYEVTIHQNRVRIYSKKYWKVEAI